MRTTGVDFDKRCNKYRIRLTRKGIVYLIAYHSSKKEACRIREETLEKYNNGEPFEYLHSYSVSTARNRLEGDDYLFQLGLSTNVTNSPQRSLLIATLVQAIKDRLGSDYNIAIDAKNWFESTTSSTLKFSFIDICQELSLKPNNVLEVINNSVKEQKPHKRLVGRRLVRSLDSKHQNQ